MQDLKVGILQFDQVWQDKATNYARILALLENQRNLDLILLPEMFHTGFSMEVSLADDWSNSEGLQFLKSLARQLDAACYTSLMVSDGSFYYNRGVFVEPNGQIHIYNKRKAFGLGQEDVYFTTGTQETIVNYRNWRFNLQICYDLRFPELVRNRVMHTGKAHYDVLLNVANWPQARIHHWDALLCARAIENQCYVVSCNRVGTDGTGLAYNGHSQVYDCFGSQLLSPTEQEGCYVVTLAHQSLQDGRNRLPFLKDA